MTIEKKCVNGFTIIEALITVFLVVVITVTFYSVFSLGLRYIVETKDRLGAIALANEKMEIVHNLAYDSIGTKISNGHGGFSYGIPAGDILEQETVSVNTRTYYIFTFVKYVQDPNDGIFPSYSAPNYYKRVNIKVAWVNDINTNKAVMLTADFVPSGIESTTGGILSINVLSSQGTGIPQAQVHLTNTNTSVDVIALTDNNGNISWPGTPADGKNYSIAISKSGYYSIQSYPPYPTSNFKPVNENASVVANVLNTKVLVTDQTSTLTIDSKDMLGNSIPNAIFSLNGGFKKGDSVETTPVPLYNFSQTNVNIGSQGEKVFNDMSYGNYSLSFSSVSGYSFVEFSPAPNNSNLFNVPPNSQTKITGYWANQNIDSLLVQVVNNADGKAIPGASVELTNASLNYDVTFTSDDSGYVYFPQSLPALSKTTYQLKVTASGFQESNSSATIDKLTTKVITLTAN